MNVAIPMPKNPQPNWYDWSIEHWGTKWDVMDSEITELSDGAVDVLLITAWECPFTALKEISTMFPELTFEGRYAEEFIPANCGKFHLKNGALKNTDMSGDVEFACGIWGYDPDEWQQDFEIRIKRSSHALIRRGLLFCIEKCESSIDRLFLDARLCAGASGRNGRLGKILE